MNIVEPDKIIDYLYTWYYLLNSTPQRFVSSHWEYYSAQLEAVVEDGSVKRLAGIGFGSLQQSSTIEKVLSWLTAGSYFLRLPDKRGILRLIKPSLLITKRMGLSFCYDCFRQVCSLALLRRHIEEGEKLNIIIIGDGYGFLSSVIKEVYPNSTIVLVDLGKVLLFQAHYCKKAHPKCSYCLVTDSQLSSQNNFDFIYCPTESLELIGNLYFDLAINIVSMQEMNAETIRLYFNYLRKHLVPENLFYCCNREVKELVGGETTEFLKYPWLEDDVYLVDEYCPWHKYTITINKVFLIPFPHICYFDGLIRHRLAVLRNEE